MPSFWIPIGGCRENPGVWDSCDGALIYVSRRGPVLRRAVRYYIAGRGPDTTRYYRADGDPGGPWPPPGRVGYATMRAALRAEKG